MKCPKCGNDHTLVTTSGWTCYTCMAGGSGKMKYLLLIAFLIPITLHAQEPTISQRLADLEARVGRIDIVEKKVDVLSAKVDKLMGTTPTSPPTPPVTLWPIPKTYAEARQQALDRNVPLVVWVAGGLCAPCVERTRDEFVHWIVPTFEGTTVTDSIVVGVPEDGQLLRLDITSWTAGHIPTIRAAVAQFRANRLAARAQRIEARAYAPMMSYAPRMMSYAGACAGGG